MLLGWAACTPVMLTVPFAPARLMVRVPLTPIGAVHADDSGTVVSSSKPLEGQTGVTLPRIDWKLTLRNAAASFAVMSAEFFSAAMPATLEFVLAGPIPAGAGQPTAPIAAAADVIVVRVREQDDVDIAKARVRFIDGEPRIVEDANASRVFEEDGAIARAELTTVASESRHSD